jgi:hypothetical protein
MTEPWNDVKDPVRREKMSETDLVSAIHDTTDARVEAAAVAELERRSIVAARDLNESIRRFEKTSRRLTFWLIFLTAVLVVATIRLAIR